MRTGRLLFKHYVQLRARRKERDGLETQEGGGWLGVKDPGVPGRGQAVSRDGGLVLKSRGELVVYDPHSPWERGGGVALKSGS